MTQDFLIYFREFQNQVFTLLGGWEMANEFFRLHPEAAQRLPEEARYHFGKGGPKSAENAAQAWFRFRAKPLLKADRQRVTQHDGFDDAIDGRR